MVRALLRRATSFPIARVPLRSGTLAPTEVTMTEEVQPKIFPKNFKDNAGNPRILINEMCECKHYRTQHWNRCVVSIGHGPCSQCGCQQFTWVGGVYGGVQPDVDEFISSIGPSIPFGLAQIDEMNEQLQTLEEEKDRLEKQRADARSDESKAYNRQSKLQYEVNAEKQKLREVTAQKDRRIAKLEKELTKFIQPFVVAKGERRSILLEPPDDGNKHTRRRNRVRKT